MTRILVTGSRDWQDYLTVCGALDSWCEHDGLDHLDVGDCTSGADKFATLYWAGLSLDDRPYTYTIYRADWRCHGRAAGPIRNQQMVDMKPDVCLAFIRNQSKGATDCKKRAEAAGIPVLLWEEP